MNTARVVLTGLLITHELSDEAVGWFSNLRDLVDELVVFVDRHPTPSDLSRKLQTLRARVVALRGNGGAIYQADLKAVLAACRGDWILKIDYDEELSPEWCDARWREILAGPHTHFWTARRWITTAGTYLGCTPWWPDWQLRLFRNLPDQIIFPTELHDNMRVSGPGGYLRTLAIDHHLLRMVPRARREAKAAAYEEQRPGHGLGFFYLPENYSPPELPLPVANDFDPAREILRMTPLKSDEATLLGIEVEPPVAELRTSELFWLQARVSNNSRQTVGAGAPFPVNLTYHWLNHVSQEAVVFDGERTPLFPPIEPNQTGIFRMFVIAPAVSGEYLLRVTLVQEEACWLDQLDPPMAQDFQVSITDSL